MGTQQERQQVLALSPKLKEMTQRHSLYYHTPSERNDANAMLVGYVFDDSIYGPLYFEYGRPTDPEDRSVVIRHVERALLKNSPESVLVLVRAEAEVIRRRMREGRHPGGVLQEKDIELVLDRFQYEFRHTLFEKKLALDTSTASVEETLAEFVERVEPHLTESDRSRMVLRGLRTR